MKHQALLALLAAVSFLVPGFAAEPDTKIQSSPLATVQLLATGRTSGGGAPDGMKFLFLVTPGAGTIGQIALKETRDFTVAGVSYQQKTLAELGRRFEPGTAVDKADAFFANLPNMRELAPKDMNGAYILSLAIRGARLPAGAKVEVTATVGFGAAVEPFKFKVTAPPVPAP